MYGFEPTLLGTIRDYGLEPQVWDDEGRCKHVWEVPLLKAENQPHTGLSKSADIHSPRKNIRNLNCQENGSIKQVSDQGQFCQKCNAWRGSLGLEPSPELYIQHIVQVFREIKQILRGDGTVWLNLGDSYATHASKRSGQFGNAIKKGFDDIFQRAKPTAKSIGLKEKDLCGIPWRVALALQADGWWLRSDIIWSKPNPMPESVTDRPTRSHEYIFLLSKSARYFYDADAVKEDSIYPNNDRKARSVKMPDGWDTGPGAHGSYHRQGREKGQKRYPTDKIAGIREGSATYPKRNLRSVWQIATQPFPGAHFATFPEKLVEPCIKAGTSEKGCCPECGGPWVRMVEKGELLPSISQHHRPVLQNPKAKRDKGEKAKATRTGGWGETVTPDCSYVAKTIGWKPTCDCHRVGISGMDILKPIPCTVLDPFGGSGVTAIVAKKLGRKSILIELKEDYCAMPLDKLRQETIS